MSYETRNAELTQKAIATMFYVERIAFILNFEHFLALPVGGIGSGYDQKLAFLISLGLSRGILTSDPIFL